MEKAILKTLLYADTSGLPLKAYEIHKWLISQPASLQQIEKALERLTKKEKVKKKKEYYFLPGRANLIRKRLFKEKKSKKHLLKAKITTWFLKSIPGIKLVGISNDYSLFIITAKTEEEKLAQTPQDIYVAHQILQMKPLWFQGKIYQKYLQENEWVFKFLPNWKTTLN